MQIPSNDSTLETVFRVDRGLMALMIPTLSPMAKATIVEKMASCVVGPIAFPMTVTTGSLVINERPRSPCSRSRSQSPYWTTRGLSSRNSCRKARMLSVVAWSRNMKITGSPGMR